MSAARPLRNPEGRWRRPGRPLPLDPREVEKRIGPVQEPLELMRGGHANLNVRVGQGKVLRVYVRDPRAVRKEASCLLRDWKSFRVPPLLETGPDFLVMEYVPHRPVLSVRSHGRAVGKALAEIHQTSFPHAGLLGPGGEVERPFPDLLESLRTYVDSHQGRVELAPDHWKEVTGFLERQADPMRLRAGSPTLLHGDFKVSNLHWSEDLPLVLDWEFAWAGPRLSDVGQLLRWRPPADFRKGFAEGYEAGGGELGKDWERWSRAFDVFNLVGLLVGADPGSRRHTDVARRLLETVRS